MSYVIAFGRFWYDFVIGDDWTIAVAVASAIAIAALLTHSGTNAYWLVPVVVVGALSASLWHAARR
jgi:hypothetical protein